MMNPISIAKICKSFVAAAILLVSTQAAAQLTASGTGTVPTPAPAPKNPKPYLDNKSFNIFMNRSFGRLATGQDNTAELSNHASFNSKGNFTFNAFTPLKQKNEGAKRISYLSFRISGGLIGENTTVIFDNKQFGTNVNVDATWHFQFQKSKDDKAQPEKREGNNLFGNYIRYLTPARINFEDQVLRLETEKNIAKQQIADQYNPKLIGERLDTYTSDIALATSYQDGLIRHLQVIRTELKTETTKLGAVPDTGIAAQQEVVEKIARKESDLLSRLDSNNAVLVKLRFRLDSITYLRDNLAKAIDNKEKAVSEGYTEKIEKLRLNPKIVQFQTNWFSLNVGIGTKGYYTFDASLPFDQQIARHKTENVRVGLQWNYFHQDFDNKRVRYFNLGVTTGVDNNLGDLETTEVSDETSVTNNNTKRKTGNKYSAYTDKVEEYQLTTLYSNLYILAGSKFFTGLHVFPSWEFRSSSKNPINVGIGLIGSFKNTEKDKAILTIEGFAKFRDVVNILHSNDQFYQRVTIGFQVGLPIQPF